MPAFFQATAESITAFCATNVDDLFLLMLFFSRLDRSLKAWQVVSGQYLGIAALVAISLLSFLGRLALPEGLIGLLGLFPISLGLSQLAETFTATDIGAGVEEEDPPLQGGLITGVLAVAGLTIANGSDNISVYMAMLANSDPLRLRVILASFAVLTGLWCLLAWFLTQTSLLQGLLRRMQRDLAPVLLMVIGGLVLYESHTFSTPPLAIVAIACLGVMATSVLHQLGLLSKSRQLAGLPQR